MRMKGSTDKKTKPGGGSEGFYQTPCDGGSVGVIGNCLIMVAVVLSKEGRHLPPSRMNEST